MWKMYIYLVKLKIIVHTEVNLEGDHFLFFLSIHGSNFVEKKPKKERITVFDLTSASASISTPPPF